MVGAGVGGPGAGEARRSAPRGGREVAGECWGRQAPSTAGVRGVGRHAQWRVRRLV